MSAVDLVARRSDCGRFLHITGSHAQPVPAAVRVILKAPPYRADFDRTRKHWRIAAAAWPGLAEQLAAEGWRAQLLDSAQAAEGTGPGAVQCQHCGKPYHWRTDPAGRRCSGTSDDPCGEPLVLISQQDAAR